MNKYIYLSTHRWQLLHYIGDLFEAQHGGSYIDVVLRGTTKNKNETGVSWEIKKLSHSLKSALGLKTLLRFRKKRKPEEETAEEEE